MNQMGVSFEISYHALVRFNNDINQAAQFLNLLMLKEGPNFTFDWTLEDDVILLMQHTGVSYKRAHQVLQKQVNDFSIRRSDF